MQRFFNTTGPCRPDEHYMLPAAPRLGPIRSFIERRQYVVVHAARQSGKTTALQALAEELLREGQVAAAVLSCEVGGAFADAERAEPAILTAWQQAARATLPEPLCPPPWPDSPVGSRILAALSTWAQVCPRPLVLLLDEIDALHDEALVSVLRQLRSGFPTRPVGFPQSVVLVGLRDVRDYLAAAGSRLGTSSPFNIKVESLTLRDFTREEVAGLLSQHTDDTGQPFTAPAVSRIHELTRGQPWLTNALAAELVDKVVPERERPVTEVAVEVAAHTLIRRRDTHLDSLMARLTEPRVRSVLEPLLAGIPMAWVPEDDRQFVVDLGLVRRRAEGGLEIANPLYGNVIARALSSGPYDAMPRVRPAWLDSSGRLVPERLLAAFLEFWKANAEPLFRAAAYPEIAPHLVMMAFLDRVANGGGTVDREYAAGAGRIDLLLRHGEVRMAFELKAWRDGQADPVERGLVQLDRYLERLSLATGWLVVFDARSGRAPVEERTGTFPGQTPSGRSVVVVRA